MLPASNGIIPVIEPPTTLSRVLPGSTEWNTFTCLPVRAEVNSDATAALVAAVWNVHENTRRSLSDATRLITRGVDALSA